MDFNDVVLFVALLIGVIFAVDHGRRWWRGNEWKRRRKRGDHDSP